MTMQTITAEYVRTVIRPRDPELHKGSCGRVLLCAGGAGMTGAAVFAARAALRSGSGLVYVCTKERNFPVLQTCVPEAICVTWDEAAEHLFGRGGWSYDAACFGPGMGTMLETKEMLRKLLFAGDQPLVIDADGLNCLAADTELAELARNYPGQMVLTPHVGEAKRLFQAAKVHPGDDRKEMVTALTRAYHCIGVLKGAGTLVAREDAQETEIWMNTTGNPGMATAGSGDVLTGLITGLAGQGVPLWDAAKAGVWIHGRAGDIAAGRIGEYGLIASDIAEGIALALKEAAGR